MQEKPRIEYTVRQNETHVWWIADFGFVAPAAMVGQPVPRRADEGGTVSQKWIAEREAESRAEWLRSQGYVVTEAIDSERVLP